MNDEKYVFRVAWSLTLLAVCILLFLAVFTGCTTAEARPSTWDQYCQKCHGVYGSGNTAMGKRLNLKDLKDSTITEDKVRVTIFNGKNKMPAFKSKLSSAEVDQLVEFVMNLRVASAKLKAANVE